MSVATTTHALDPRTAQRPRSRPDAAPAEPSLQAPARAAAAPVGAQGGLFDELMPGLLGAASTALSGNGAGALAQVRETGAAAVPGLAQQGAGALGGLIGGTTGEAVSSLGAPIGQGLSSVISGESTPGQAAGGLLASAQPMLLSLLASLLNS